MPTKIKNYIDSWKNDLICPTRRWPMPVARRSRPPPSSTALPAHAQGVHAVDFNDLILLPVKLFQEHADILEKWQNRIRYLLVDEYQDTNASQYLLVKMLVGMRNQFTGGRRRRPVDLRLARARAGKPDAAEGRLSFAEGG
nr:UvrD-helicase domain-containing protein [Pseudomonas mendocina]